MAVKDSDDSNWLLLKIPKKVDEGTAMRVTRDALAVETPRWFLGDSESDTLAWHDWLLEQSVVPVGP